MQKRRKLKLRKETLRRLDDTRLGRVAGGTFETNLAHTVCWCPTAGCSNGCATQAGCGEDPPTYGCTRPPSVCNSCAPTVCC